MKHGDRIRQEILEAGLKLWHYNPETVTTRNIGKLIDKTHTAVFHHYPTGVKKAVAAYGVQKGDSVVIVHLLLIDDPLVKNITDEERAKHFLAVKELNKQSQEQV